MLPFRFAPRLLSRGRRFFASLNVDAKEIERFSKMPWWNREGEGVGPLHAMNPVRIGFIRDHLTQHFQLEPPASTFAVPSFATSGQHTAHLPSFSITAPLRGLRVLDVGCGGGLLSEPLARLGAHVTGIDASSDNIRIARMHAQQTGLADSHGDSLNYVNSTAEQLCDSGQKFDAVCALEIVEHVPDQHQFLRTCAELVKPGGALFVSTLNRTAFSFATAIVGAEYIAGVIPVGTHQWDKFLTPDELSSLLATPLPTERPEVEGRTRAIVVDVAGMVYNPVLGSWRLSRNLSCNYIAFAKIFR